MAAEELLNHCYNILSTFKPNDEDSELFLQNYIATNKIKDPILVKHITAVFFGCVKFDKVIRIVVDAFYAKEGSTILLSERHIYTVLTYLVLFYLDTIGIAAFRHLVDTLHIIRMHKFLSVLCNEQNLLSWMKEAWKRIYDAHFVETKLVNPLMRWLAELSELVTQLENKITNAEQNSIDDEYGILNEKPKNITAVKPFNLTKPKPRAVPVPEMIAQLPKTRNPPESNYVPPKDREAVEEKRAENRRKAQALLEEANANEFSCAAASRTKPEKVLKRLEELRLEQKMKYAFIPPRMNPTPKSAVRSETTIKLNTAAILREKKLCEDIEREQLKRIEELENGAFSDAEYRAWKAAVDEQQAQVAQAEADRRIVEARLAREMAELAHTEAAVERKKVADSMKEEASRRLKQLLVEKITEKEEMRQMVEQIAADRGKISEAKARLKEIKQKIVQEVTAESREMLAQALEEAESEMHRRAELIAHIRALESVPLVRQKLFDRTEPAGHGFLEEMSIAELEERISIMKAAKEKEIMERQDVIVQDKRQHQQMLTEAMDRIARHRMARSRVLAAAKLKEAAEVDATFLSLTSAASTRTITKSHQDKQRDLNKLETEKRAQLQERRDQIAQQLRSTISGSSVKDTSTPAKNDGRRKAKFRKLLEEKHFQEFENAQRKTDRAIGQGRKDWDSLRLLHS